MNKDQLDNLTKHLEAVVKDTVHKSVKEIVNGKIDRLQKAFDDHQIEMQPVLDIYSTASNINRFTINISKFLLAIASVGGVVVGGIKLLKRFL